MGKKENKPKSVNDLIIDEDAVNDEIEKNVNINYLDNKDS